MSTANVTKGRSRVLLVRNDADTLWEVIGGAQTTNDDVTNSTEDVTSSSTVGEYSEKQFTGFADSQISISGAADKRVGEVNPETGFLIVGYERLDDLANQNERCAKIRLVDVSTGRFKEGVYIITSLSTTSETKSVVKYNATFESSQNVVRG